MINGKVWGQTELLESNGSLELHRIEIDPGGICSKHRHNHKWNGFFVEKGDLEIRVWKKDYDLVDTTILRSGQYTKVPPGEFHQFEALSRCIVFELYWTEFNPNDIERESVGFVR
jgi:mannose-6-phosphate isomerase-like protein (cupin superfamily)